MSVLAAIAGTLAFPNLADVGPLAYRYLRLLGIEGYQALWASAEIEFYYQGVKLVGTPMASETGYFGSVPADASDGVLTNFWGTGTAINAWWGIDLGAGNESPCDEVRVIARSGGNAGQTLQIGQVQGSNVSIAVAGDQTNLFRHIQSGTAPGANVTQTSKAYDHGESEYWHFEIQESNANGLILSGLELREIVGGPSLMAGAVLTTDIPVNSGDIANLNDGDLSTKFHASGGAPNGGIITVQLASPAKVNQVLFSSHADGPSFVPKWVNVYRSDDGINLVRAWDLDDQGGAYSHPETREFRPAGVAAAPNSQPSPIYMDTFGAFIRATLPSIIQMDTFEAFVRTEAPSQIKMDTFEAFVRTEAPSQIKMDTFEAFARVTEP